MILSELFSFENAMNLDYRILCIVGTLLFLSLLFIVLGTGQFLRGKIITASIHSLSGLSLFLAGLLFLSIAINLYSYERLTYEQDIAELKFKQIDKQRFRVDITYQNDNKIDNFFLINGDEWHTMHALLNGMVGHRY